MVSSESQMVLSESQMKKMTRNNADFDLDTDKFKPKNHTNHLIIKNHSSDIFRKFKFILNFY